MLILIVALFCNHALPIQACMQLLDLVEIPNDTCTGKSDTVDSQYGGFLLVNGICYSSDECSSKGGEASGSCGSESGTICCINIPPSGGLFIGPIGGPIAGPIGGPFPGQTGGSIPEPNGGPFTGSSPAPFPGPSSGPFGPFPGPTGGPFPGPSGGPFPGPSGGPFPGPNGGPFPGPSSGPFPGSSPGPFPGSPSGPFGPFPGPPSKGDPDAGLSGCEEIEWVGDGICDDGNNHKDCVYDGGDCCASVIDKTFCNDCLYSMKRSFCSNSWT